MTATTLTTKALTPNGTTPPARRPPVVVSRHSTSRGTVVWSRCGTCGRLRMTYSPRAADERPLKAGQPTPGCPDCP